MSANPSTLISSHGKKLVLGITGLMLCTYLVLHLLGNFALLQGPETFNGYAKKLYDTGLLPLIEAGLFAVFLLHIVWALWTASDNLRARPEPYVMHRAKGGRTLSSRTMVWTGVLVLVFLIVHVVMFRLGEWYHDPTRGRTLYELTIAAFANPVIVFFYVAMVLLLGLHVRHGLQSALRSIGINHPRWQPHLDRLAVAFGFVIALGFAFLPIWVILAKH
jgi:succinate dehydrogenase / fumarate reductase cytochrome b subunit